MTLLPLDPVELQSMIVAAVHDAVAESLAALHPTSVKQFNPKEWMLSRQEAAEVLRLSFQTLRSYEQRGILRPQRVGRRVLYPIAEIERVLNGEGG